MSVSIAYETEAPNSYRRLAMPEDREENQAAYRRLKKTIAAAYRAGRLVAIAGGRIVADADDFDEMRRRLAAQGKHSANVLVVQAGVDYPETADIFAGLP